MNRVEYSSRFDVSREELFAWHVRPGALDRLLPPWEDVRIVSRGAGVSNGSKVTLSVPVGPGRIDWVARHFDVDPPRQFRDEQVSGPFHRWLHTHLFKRVDAQGELLDQIEYELPLEGLSGFLAGKSTRKSIDAMFRFRHERVRNDLARHEMTRGKLPLRLLISGAGGLLGSQLVPFFTTGGHEVITLVRRPVRANSEIQWDPEAGQLDPAAIEGFDAVINLSGRGIAEGRWTPQVKQEIVQSRTRSTRLLSERIASLNQPPKVLVNASAIGYYGNRGADLVTEESAPGTNFLADVCRQWEAATEPAERAGIRVVKPRIAAVLSAKGGALQKLLTPFKLGVGGRLGLGKQGFSWIAIDDLVGVLHQCVVDERLSGPVNASAPQTPSNEEFVRVLGRVLNRPTVAPLPAMAVKLMFGQMGEEVLLSGSRVDPAKLKKAGFRYDFPSLEEALRWELGTAE